jgi:hypothetical protein
MAAAGCLNILEERKEDTLHFRKVECPHSRPHFPSISRPPSPAGDVETVDVVITGGKLVITFTPQVENHQTSGIEIIPAKE